MDDSCGSALTEADIPEKSYEKLDETALEACILYPLIQATEACQRDMNAHGGVHISFCPICLLVVCGAGQIMRHLNSQNWPANPVQYH